MSNFMRGRFRPFCWFLLVNGVIASLIATRYLAYVPEVASVISWIYVGVALIGQMGFIVALFGIAALPLLFISNHTVRGLLLALIASLGLTLLVVDTLVFDLYRFHFNSVLVSLVFSGGIVKFNFFSWFIVLLGSTLLFCLEYWVYRWLLAGRPLSFSPLAVKRDEKKSLLIRCYTTLVIFSVFAAHLVHIWASARGHSNITSMTRYLPAFYPATANSLMRRLGLANNKVLEEQKQLRPKTALRTLNYPVNTLLTQSIKKPKNIVFIVIDAWRADAFNHQYTPNLWQLAQTGSIFNNHMSTGNSTRTGIFGLFYGIPGTYWHSFLSSQRSPVFMDRLQALNYELGVFASAHLLSPEFDRTVFSQVTNLRVRSEGASAYERDKNATDDWLHWNETRDKNRPAFSFVFYDSLHAYDFPQGYPHQFKPMSDGVDYLALNSDFNANLLINRYHTSTHFVDSQAGRIIRHLKEKRELDNTLIVITSDHGEEFNDNGKNYWGHNSNFTSAQVHIPLSIVGLDADIADKWNVRDLLTSHEDIVPTIMSRFLGVKNPVSDYSTGNNLFHLPKGREWVISSNYSRYAVIEAKSILEVSYAGTHQFFDQKYAPIDKPLNVASVEAALKKVTQFMK